MRPPKAPRTRQYTANHPFLREVREGYDYRVFKHAKWLANHRGLHAARLFIESLPVAA